MMQKLRKHKRLGMAFVLIFLVGIILIVSLASILYRSDLQFERNSYSVLKNHATTSCIITNRGRRIAEKSRMYVNFESKILDIEFSPSSSGKIGKLTSDGHEALLELNNVDSGDFIEIFFSVERMQDTPFHIQLLDISADIPIKEQTTPLK